jgi:hypothetical protein
VPKCNRKGKYEFFIAGYPCLDSYGRELICKKHADEWSGAFADVASRHEQVAA